MSVQSELYARLSPLVGAGLCFDTKADDDLIVTAPIIVFSNVGESPDYPIDGTIIGREQRWQVSVYAPDIASARATKAAVITALHGYSGSAIKWCAFENAFEFHDTDVIPPLYHTPIDFVVEL